MQTRLLNIAGQQPGNRRDMTVPGPLSVLGVAVLARSLEDRQRGRIDLGFTKNGVVVSGGAGHPERMNQRTANRDDCGDSCCDENISNHRGLSSHLPDNCCPAVSVMERPFVSEDSFFGDFIPPAGPRE